MKKSRRNFLKLAGATMGGAVLASCSPSGGPPEPRGGAQLPNGFRFTAIKNVGDVLPNGKRIKQLRTDAVISGKNEVIYSVLHDDDTVGLYGATVDFAPVKPRVIAERTVLTDGERVPGGVVASFNAYDINSKGDLVLPVQVATDEMVSAEKVAASFLKVTLNGVEADKSGYGESMPKPGKGLYVQNPDLGLQRLAFGDQTTVEGHEFYHLFGAAAVYGDDILFVADFAKGKAGGAFGEPTQGIFHMSLSRALSTLGTNANADVNTSVNARLVEQNGLVAQLNTQGDHVAVNRYGLLDLHENGHFVLQGHTSVPAQVQTQQVQTQSGEAGGQIGGVLVAGNLNDPSAKSVISTAAETGLSILSVENASAYGQNSFGPRMGPNNIVVNVVHTSDEAMTLFYGGRRVVAYGDLSPSGDIVEGVMPGCFGPQGEHYYGLTLRGGGMELAAYDGQQQRSLLKDGDTLVDESVAVGGIFMGTMLKQVNDSTHLAFQVTREDGSMALVVGSPF